MGALDAQAMAVCAVQWWASNLHWTELCYDGDGIYM